LGFGVTLPITQREWSIPRPCCCEKGIELGAYLK
jgi:hypothetical protein